MVIFHSYVSLPEGTGFPVPVDTGELFGHRQVDAVPSPPAPPVSDSRSALLRQIQVAWEGPAEVWSMGISGS